MVRLANDEEDVHMHNDEDDKATTRYRAPPPDAKNAPKKKRSGGGVARIIQLLIGTRLGVRVEYLPDHQEDNDDDCDYYYDDDEHDHGGDGCIKKEEEEDEAAKKMTRPLQHRAAMGAFAAKQHRKQQQDDETDGFVKQEEPAEETKPHDGKRKKQDTMILLHHGNGFANRGYRVVRWGVHTTSLLSVTQGQFQSPTPMAQGTEYDADGSEGEHVSRYRERDTRRKRRRQAPACPHCPRSDDRRRCRIQRTKSRAASVEKRAKEANDEGDETSSRQDEKRRGVVKRRRRRTIGPTTTTTTTATGGAVAAAAATATATTTATTATVAEHVIDKNDHESGDEEGGDDSDDGSDDRRRGDSGKPAEAVAKAVAEAVAEEGKEETTKGKQKKRWIELFLSDHNPEEVAFVWVIPWVSEAQARCAQRSMAHAPHGFRIENTCGSCRTPFELNLSTLRCLRKKEGRRSSIGDLITMLSGTFAPCANRLQVDFRGVRAVKDMLEDWELLSGIRAAETTTTIYMLVMKACLGFPVLIVDYGTNPLPAPAPSPPSTPRFTTPKRKKWTPASCSPSSTRLVPVHTGDGRTDDGRTDDGAGGSSNKKTTTMTKEQTELQHEQRQLAKSRTLAAAGHKRCYLAERMAPWISGYTQHVDVCQAIELTDIRWEAIVPDVCDILRHARSSAHISRRGGVMLRLIFPRGTEWGEEQELRLLRDCNQMLEHLRGAIKGGDLG